MYGITDHGGLRSCSHGQPHGWGVIYKLNSIGKPKEVVLYTFANAVADGAFPLGPVTRDSEGNLYGTTSTGGSNLYDGTVFRVDPSGNETVLYSFKGPPDGYNPISDLVLDRQGNVYETTAYGGAMGCGTVFKVNPSGQETSSNSMPLAKKLSFIVSISKKATAPIPSEV